MSLLRSFFSTLRSFGLYVSAVFGAFFIMVLASNLYVRDIVRDQMIQYGKTTMKYAEAHVRFSFSKMDGLLNDVALSVAEILDDRDLGKGNIEEFLAEWTKKAKLKDEAVGRVFVRLDGEMFGGSGDASPENVDVREKPWYRGALESDGRVSYTETFPDGERDELVVSLSRTVYDNSGKYRGIAVLDFHILSFGTLLEGLHLVERGYGVLLNEDFRFIVHRNPARIGVPLREIGEKVLNSRKAANLPIGEDEAVSSTEFVDADNVRSIAFLKKLSNGWYIGIIAPMDNFYGKVSAMGIALSLLGFLLMTLLSYFLLKQCFAKTRSEAASRVKTSFITNISHEIRTPINSIMGMSELILREEPTDPTIVEYVWEIKRASANLLDIINDVLDISKIEAGKLEIALVEYEFPSMLHDVLNIIKMRIGYKTIDFIVDLDPRLPFKLLGDELRVRQVLLNLLGNAVKFTEKGYVRLSVQGEKHQDKIELKFTIADSGIGIRKKDMDKLFKEFSQVDTKKNRSIEGTGLGLAITEKLCAMMNGRIEFSSQYGTGSVFTVTLEQGVVDASPMMTVENASAIRTLVYDKSWRVAGSLAAAIRALGAHCDLCETRRLFHKALERGHHDYAFISDAESREWVLKRAPTDTAVVWIAEYDHINREQGEQVLRKPITCIQVGNILNDKVEAPYRRESSREDISFAAPSARILIVDDNVTNLKVATGLMRGYMMQVDTALSGPEALSKIVKNDYDLVFMDHMMSDMDGVETTAEIRKTFKDLPIVALTANAVNGAKEFFIAQGMDDFLPKPINLKKLNLILKKYIPAEKRREVGRGPADAGTFAAIEIDGIDTAKGLENCGSSSESYMAVLSTFYLDGLVKTLELERFYKKRDIGGFVVLAHALKTACAQIGADNTAKMAAALEAAGRRGDVKFIEYNLNPFIADFESVLHRLLPIVHAQREEKEPKPPGRKDFLRAELAALFEALDTADAGAIDSILDEIGKYSWDEDTARRLMKIHVLVDTFEYDEARQYLRPSGNPASG